VILDKVGSTHSSRVIDPYPTITRRQPCGAASWISYPDKRQTRTRQPRHPRSDQEHHHDVTRPATRVAHGRQRLPSPARAAEPRLGASRRQSVSAVLPNSRSVSRRCAPASAQLPGVSSPRCGMLPAGHTLPVNGHCGRADEPPRKQKPQTAAVEQPLPQRAAHSAQALGHRRSRPRRAPDPLPPPP
jgi:hypothetical protein